MKFLELDGVAPAAMKHCSGRQLKAVELFAGCGGLALGFSLAGVEHSLVVEIDDSAVKTLRTNTNWPIVAGDARKIDYSIYAGADLVTGGPPCQPFSIGGEHKGEADPRDMFPEAVRAIEAIRPRAFVFENVPGLVRPKFSGYLERTLSALTTVGDGYRVSHRLVNTADYGIPQTRRRVFIIGFRQDEGEDWSFPEPTHQEVEWVSAGEALADMPPPGDTAPKGLQGHIRRDGAKTYPGHTGSPTDRPAKTIKAGVNGVPGGENMLQFADGSVRYFTIREAARLQTFPDTWLFPGSWSVAMRQLGNAVPVEMARIVAESVASSLD